LAGGAETDCEFVGLLEEDTDWLKADFTLERIECFVYALPTPIPIRKITI
jgi:hypothetical protein